MGPSATAYDGRVWRAQATFAADDHGIVGHTAMRPQLETYDKVDGMDLLWSMRPPSGDPDEESFAPATRISLPGATYGLADPEAGRKAIAVRRRKRRTR
ncbi:acyl-CoA thioesterase/BAAT N-terminal domain-containing protein [Streptomyces sp. NPDC054783]